MDQTLDGGFVIGGQSPLQWMGDVSGNNGGYDFLGSEAGFCFQPWNGKRAWEEPAMNTVRTVSATNGGREVMLLPGSSLSNDGDVCPITTECPVYNGDCWEVK
jgi:hypothetical protein